MNFKERMLPTSMDYAFREEGYYVWCGTMLRHGGAYYLIYSRWEEKYGFEAWVTHSEICLARADSLFGKFSHVKVLFQNESDAGVVFHNPTVIEWKGAFYLYYMTNESAGDWWAHRNSQRIGVAYAHDPEGEWTRVKEPVIGISEEGIDSLMTSNPTATVTPDGKLLMVYKAVSKYGDLPAGGKVLCGAAEAEHPLGPFRKYGKPIMENPEDPWSVEDPYVWREGDRYYALVKDFHGYFTQTAESATALFESGNGFDWHCAETPLAFENTLHLEKEAKPLRRMERPQLYIENGTPKCLLCACMEDDALPTTYSIRIPLK